MDASALPLLTNHQKAIACANCEITVAGMPAPQNRYYRIAHHQYEYR